MSDNDLKNYYEVNFTLQEIHKWNIDTIEMMMPFERNIYVNLLNAHLAKLAQSSSGAGLPFTPDSLM